MITLVDEFVKWCVCYVVHAHINQSGWK